MKHFIVDKHQRILEQIYIHLFSYISEDIATTKKGKVAYKGKRDFVYVSYIKLNPLNIKKFLRAKLQIIIK